MENQTPKTDRGWRRKIVTFLLTLSMGFGSGTFYGRYKVPYTPPDYEGTADKCPLDGEHIISRVLDGDTIAFKWCGHEEKMRMIGMNAPEVHNSQTGVQCFGPEAAKHATGLLLNKKVRVETEDGQGDRNTRRDMHGRFLGYVFLPDGRNFAEVMIAEGYAHEEQYDKRYKYAAEFNQAEINARARNKGMWGDPRPDCADESEKTTVREPDHQKRKHRP